MGARGERGDRRTITAYNFGIDGGAFEEVAGCFTKNGVFELASGERAQWPSTIVRVLERVRQSPRPDDGAQDAAAPSFVYTIT